MAGQSAPEWIVTFSDIVSLLVTFFILLLTWSTLETDKFEMIAGALNGALGVVGSTKNEASLELKPQLRTQRSDEQGADEPAEERLSDKPYENMAVRLRRQFGEAIEFEKLRKGFRIRITAGTLFRPGSAELLPAYRQGLSEIARSVRTRYNAIRVDGHADTHFRPTPRYPDAWSLSIARATAAARYLVEEGGIAAERISAAGYGSHRPAYRDDTPETRVRNRRIEIVILEEPKKRG